jgi:hypothetical protein
MTDQDSAGSSPAGGTMLTRAISSAAEQPIHIRQAGGSTPPLRTEDEAEGSKRRIVDPVQAGFESRHPPQPASALVGDGSPTWKLNGAFCPPKSHGIVN